jgi:hypothetical protein
MRVGTPPICRAGSLPEAARGGFCARSNRADARTGSAQGRRRSGTSLEACNRERTRKARTRLCGQTRQHRARVARVDQRTRERRGHTRTSRPAAVNADGLRVGGVGLAKATGNHRWVSSLGARISGAGTASDARLARVGPTLWHFRVRVFDWIPLLTPTGMVSCLTFLARPEHHWH